MAAPRALGLSKLQIYYCKHSASSNGVRDLIKSGFEFLREKAAVEVETIERSGHHPFVKATFANGITYDWGLRNFSFDAAGSVLIRLRDRVGRRTRSLKAWKEPVSATPSVQGHWRPNMHSAPIVLVNRAGHADDAYSARLESVAALKNHPHAAVVQETLSSPLTLARRLVPIVRGPQRVQATTTTGILAQLNQNKPKPKQTAKSVKL